MAKIGIIPVPINIRLHPKELQFIIQHSDSVGLVIGPEYTETWKELKPALKKAKCLVSTVKKVEGMKLYEELIETGSPEEPDITIDEDDTFLLCYTGGTTGLPKGVVLTHRNLLTWTMGAHLLTVKDPSRIAPGNASTLYILPAFHISLWPILMFHFSGDKVVMMKRPDIKLICEAIQAEHITHMNSVPTVYFWLLNFPERKNYDFSSVKSFTYAGAPFPTEVLKQCIEVFGNIFSQGYGATEGGPWTSLDAKDHYLEGPETLTRRLKSAGKPSLVCDIRIVDEKGNEVETGTIGEVTVRSKTTMKEYWKDPEKTKAVKKGEWYWTGDMGSFDEDGFLYLADRAADMIKSGGERVYPTEVEDTLYKHPAISEAIVVGLPDPEWGERVHALVYIKPDQQQKYKGKEDELKQDIIEFCRRDLTRYKCPKTIDFSDKPLPKTAIGKMLRKEVREKYRGK